MVASSLACADGQRHLDALGGQSVEPRDHGEQVRAQTGWGSVFAVSTTSDPCGWRSG